MAEPALKLVPQEEPKILPKFLSAISPDAQLSEIFVYSQRDFYTGSRAIENGRKFDDKLPLIPAYGETNKIDLAGSFTPAQVKQAVKAMERNEDPAITALRETIVNAVEEKKLYDLMVRTPEEAHEQGIVFMDGFISEEPIPLGIMAYEP